MSIHLYIPIVFTFSTSSEPLHAQSPNLLQVFLKKCCIFLSNLIFFRYSEPKLAAPASYLTKSMSYEVTLARNVPLEILEKCCYFLKRLVDWLIHFHLILSPIWCGFAPGFVNYKKKVHSTRHFLLIFLPKITSYEVKWVLEKCSYFLKRFEI